MNRLIRTKFSAVLAETLILICLIVMFLAGNDIWHDTGSPDFWHLNKPPFADVRVFVGAYYALVALAMGRMLIRLGGLIIGRRQER